MKLEGQIQTDQKYLMSRKTRLALDDLVRVAEIRPNLPKTESGDYLRNFISVIN